jgi:hypothetical protein
MDDSDERPWWLSRDGQAGGPRETGDAADHESNAQDGSAGSTQGWDLTSMLGMLGSLAGQWWESSGAGAHAGHDDAADHPDCVICMGLTRLSASTASESLVLPAVRWLPIRRP